MKYLIERFNLIRADYTPGNPMDSPTYLPNRFDEATGFLQIVPVFAMLPENAQIIGVRHFEYKTVLLAKCHVLRTYPKQSKVELYPIKRREFILVPYGAPFDFIEGGDKVYIGDYPNHDDGFSIFELVNYKNNINLINSDNDAQPGNADSHS